MIGVAGEMAMPLATHPTASSFPDPVLTANLYCRERLDQVVQQVVLPLSRDLSAIDATGASYVWGIRYGRCGEHLKVRVHAPEQLRPRLQESLSVHAGAFFTALGEPATTGGPEPEPEVAVPPIDVEDAAAANYPDRSLLWTQYRRSHISLGGKPFLADDHYVALMTTCLGRGCERMLDAFANKGEISHSYRQTILLDSLINGLAAVGFTVGQRAAYLEFHRDWLLRFNLVRNRVDAEKTRAFLDRFERRAETAVTALNQLRDMTAEHWAEPPREAACHGTWGHSLLDLLEFVRPFSANPDYHIDPFATDPVFPILFKALHGFANQLGLKMLDEALAYHLLLRAISAASNGVLEVVLIPP